MNKIFQKIKYYLWDKYFGISWLMFIILTISTFTLLAYRDQKTITKNKKYTIGTITSEWHHKKTGKPAGVDFIYEVKGSVYDKVFARSLKKGNKYLVVFDSIHPNRFCLLPFYELDKNFNYEIPSVGWKFEEIPFLIDTIKVNNYINDWNVQPCEY